MSALKSKSSSHEPESSESLDHDRIRARIHFGHDPHADIGETREASSLRAQMDCFERCACDGLEQRAGAGERRSKTCQPNPTAGHETYSKYCAACHRADATGNGPAAIALKPAPSNLTTLAKRYDGKFPSGFVGALVKFGRNLAAHGSGDMPVWGSRFKELDPVKDPTGQQHVDDLVAYVETLQ